MTVIETSPLSPFEEVSDIRTSVMDADTVKEVYEKFGDYWKPDYSLYRRPDDGLAIMKQKFVDIAGALKNESGMTLTEKQIEEDLVTSLESVDRFYEEWTSEENLGNGSFAFMVPTRAERENGFAPEYKPFYPLISHIGSRLGQLMLVGTPPFVVDRYSKGENGSGEQGVMLFAPVFGDMMTDIKDPEELGSTFNQAIEDAVKFARDRLGVSSVGLGAILPAVTNFGRTINVEGVKTTTGHGGTIHLINETISQAAQQGIIDEDIRNIGVIGLGSIGASVADVVADQYPDANLVLCDTNPEKVARTIDSLNLPEGRYRVADSALSMLAMKDCKVIICATTTPVNIPEQVLNSGSQSIDRLIVDDSQPTAVNPIDAKNNAGAYVAWPIGSSSDTRLHRENFDYGDLGPIGNGVWGCEAEAFTTWMQPELALRGPVTPETAKRISDAATDLGIGAAALQCYGKYVV